MSETIVRCMEQNKRDLAMYEDKMALAKQLAHAGKEDEARMILQEIAMLSTRITCRQREMLCTENPAGKADVERIITETHPMEIGFTPEGWFGLRMEPLARSKDTASKEYIRGIIYPALRRFFADKATVRYPKCTLIFRHVYNRNTPEAQYRDYDTVEVKLVTDAVAMYVMVDDNPLHCRSSHCCAPGMESRTEVYVVPQKDFAKWCAMEDNIPDEGMPLSPCIPDAWKVDI